jgi:hypothetical protein
MHSLHMTCRLSILLGIQCRRGVARVLTTVAYANHAVDDGGLTGERCLLLMTKHALQCSSRTTDNAAGMLYGSSSSKLRPYRTSEQCLLTRKVMTAPQTMCQPQHRRRSWAQQQMLASPCGCPQLPAGSHNKLCNEPPGAPRPLQHRKRQDDEHVTFATTGNRSSKQHASPGSSEFGL